MKEDIRNILCDLQERAAKDIRKLLDTKPDFSAAEWKAAGDAVDVIKDVEESIKDALTSAAMKEEYGGYEERGDSERMPMNYGRHEYWHTSRPTYGGNSYNSGSDQPVMNLRKLMNNANSESERMMYQRFIEEAERMR